MAAKRLKFTGSHSSSCGDRAALPAGNRSHNEEAGTPAGRPVEAQVCETFLDLPGRAALTAGLFERQGRVSRKADSARQGRVPRCQVSRVVATRCDALASPELLDRSGESMPSPDSGPHASAKARNHGGERIPDTKRELHPAR